MYMNMSSSDGISVCYYGAVGYVTGSENVIMFPGAVIMSIHYVYLHRS